MEREVASRSLRSSVTWLTQCCQDKKTVFIFLWHKLPEYLRSDKTVSSFKSGLKQYCLL